MERLELRYTTPATEWTQILPIGNGHLGGMVWGGINKEIIGLNEETLWSGYYKDKNNPQARQGLEEVRKLIFADEFQRADQLVHQKMLGEYNESYLPLGNFEIEFNHHGTVTDYQRRLDLSTGVVTVSYLVDGEPHQREYFASYPQKAMFIKLSGKELNILASFSSQLKTQTQVKKSSLSITGQCPEHVDPHYVDDTEEPIIQGTKGQIFSGEISVIETDGVCTETNYGLQVTNAESVTFMISFVRNPIKKAGQNRFEKAKEIHMADYQSLFNKVELNLGEQRNVATDIRLEELKKGSSDPGMYALYFQFGRYLLIASSRKNSLPANLQGIWNWEMRAAWSSNWTININLQMNYWLAQVGNLSECLPPYFDLLERVVEEGKKTAAVHYGTRGFVAHHNLDYWLNTNPVGIVTGEKEGRGSSAWWSMWPMGGAWLCQELYKHYEYSLDEQFLRETAQPILREASLFLLDWLVEYQGEYTTNPASSPENQFLANGEPYTVTHGTAMDVQLIQEVFRDYQRTCQVLGLDDPLLPDIAEKLTKLRPLKIGSDGRILEWHEEVPEREPGHRHLNLMYGLYPSDLFEEGSSLYEASKKSLAHRLKHSDAHVGWSCAWLINIFAILGDEQQAYHYLNVLLTESTLNNLWDYCYWYERELFQIDGNFGGAAGIANMLVHERHGELKLLPALPAEFSQGSLKGIALKGRKTIDMTWKDGQVVTYKINDI